MNIREKALEFATLAHKDQFRRDGVTPYITHPIAVAEIALKYIEDNKFWSDTELLDEVYAVAILHDTQEDNLEVDSDLIKAHFGWRIALAVDNLTKRDNETYLDSILRAKPWLPSRIVKIADNTHNLSTLGGKKDKHKIDKYLMSRYILEH